MTDFLLLAFIFLVAGIIAVPLASRLKLGSVLGYLLAGIAISPLLTALHVDVISIQHFAEFGVVMMLFLVGLELEPRLLWDMRSRLLGLGGLQVGATALLVAGIACLLGQPWSVALAIGLVFSLSSTAIVLQTLSERGLMRSDGGNSSFSVLLFQDIAVIPMLALLPLLALPEPVSSAPATGLAVADTALDTVTEHQAADFSIVAGLPGWQAALITIAAIGVVIVIGSRLTTPLFRFIAMANLREMFTATALMMIIGIALLMSLVGLSPALGTFLAGVVLANSEYRHELESDIDPFRGLLLGLFFMTVGAGIDFGLLSENFYTIAGLTLALMALKAMVLLILAVRFKVTGADRWLFALGLAQAGEFGFVLLSYAVGIAVIPADVADRLLLVVAMSMLLTPLLFVFFDRVIAPRYARTEERRGDTIDIRTRVIIAGHGRVGGNINRILRARGYETTVIDYNSEHLERLRAFGFRVYYGDATRPDMLHAAGIEDAAILVIAIDGRQQITNLAKYVMKKYPHVKVIARAVERHHVYDLWFAGCREIIRDTFDSSLRMGRVALEQLGHPTREASDFVEEFRATDAHYMREMADVYVPDVPIHTVPEYVSKARELNAVTEAQLRAASQGGSVSTQSASADSSEE